MVGEEARTLSQWSSPLCPRPPEVMGQGWNEAEMVRREVAAGAEGVVWQNIGEGKTLEEHEDFIPLACVVVPAI